MRPNKLKEKWRKDEPTFGVWLSACSAFLTEHVAAVGFDWLLVDGEHSAVDLQTMVQMFQAISIGSSIPMARVHWNDAAQARRASVAAEALLRFPLESAQESARSAVEIAP